MKKIIIVNDSIYKEIDVRKKYNILNINNNHIYTCNNIINKIIIL